MRIFKLPDLGEGLHEATIRQWLVKEGDEVALDQSLLSVETAKATVEVPSPRAGRIAKLHGKLGEVMKVGAPLVEFDSEEVGAATIERKIPIRNTGVVGAVKAGDKPAAGGSPA